MIYRNSELARTHRWELDPNSDAGTVARHFLAGELDLLRFTRSDADVVRDLTAFLECASGVDLEVHRGTDGSLLVCAPPWFESLLLTGRTAHVLRSYIDSELVKMEDRFDMTVRHAVAAY
ncbi:MAG TPA: hypothetical protein VF057_04990 [Thermoanaerobaculia bacterium]